MREGRYDKRGPGRKRKVACPLFCPYDNASRVTAITHNGPSGLIESLTYTYDAAGNRISLTRTNGTATLLPAAVQAAYDAANEQIQFNAASPNQTFDANGNLTSQTDASGTTAYTWDARNRLVAISGPGLSASFSYDALGRRISKTINASTGLSTGGVTTSYLYDGNDIVQEIGGGAVGASYVRSLNIDEPFVRQSATNEFHHTDALGSTLDLTNQAGAVETSYHYEAFGKTTMTGTSSNPFQYTGRENDGSGLYYYRARYYNPRVQRFLSEDPLGFSAGDPNLYAYVGGNPISRVDPRGTVSWTGSQTGGEFFTAGGFLFNLTSECANGQRAYAKVLAVGPGLGFGLQISATSESVVFEDGLSTLDPSVFNGIFLSSGAGFSIPPTPQVQLGQILVTGEPLSAHGVSADATQLGGARAIGVGPVRGLDVSVGFLVGSSTVLESRSEKCSR